MLCIPYHTLATVSTVTHAVPYPSNGLQEAADRLCHLSHLTVQRLFAESARHALPHSPSNRRQRATNWLFSPSCVVVQATTFPHHPWAIAIMPKKTNRRAASSIHIVVDITNPHCIPPIHIEPLGHPRYVSMIICTLIHPSSRSSDYRK